MNSTKWSVHIHHSNKKYKYKTTEEKLAKEKNNKKTKLKCKRKKIIRFFLTKGFQGVLDFNHKLTWGEDNFWARSSKKQHKPIGNSRVCISFLVCVEEDESQLMNSDVPPFNLNFLSFSLSSFFSVLFGVHRLFFVKTFFR